MGYLYGSYRMQRRKTRGLAKLDGWGGLREGTNKDGIKQTTVEREINDDDGDDDGGVEPE